MDRDMDDPAESKKPLLSGSDQHSLDSEAEEAIRPNKLGANDIPAVDSKLMNTSDEKDGKMSSQKASSLSTTRKFILGIIIVIMIAVTWVGATQTAKSTYSGGFKAPFFLMWFGTGFMISVFPLTAPFYFISGRGRFNSQGLREMWRHSAQVFSEQGITFCSLLSSTVLFGIIWAITNYMYDRALITIAATDVTALFSSAPAFVFFFSMCILREPPLILRFLSVGLAIAGIVLFAWVDGFQSPNSSGVLLSVAAAIGAAFYKVLLKRRVGDASLYQMSLFLTMLGLFSTFFLWPIAVALHFVGAEKVIDVPWTYICASSVLGVAFNFSINFGIAYTFPLFISLGTILGIPINAVVDTVFRDVGFLNWKFVAADLIVGGFLLMLVPPSDSVCIQNYFRCKKPTNDISS